MNRRLLLFLVFAPSLACEAILGLHDRTLRDSGTDGAEDAACEGAMCACGPHAFCENFDTYGSLQDLAKTWTVPGVQNSVIQLNGTVTLDTPTTVLPPSTPNALLTTVSLKSLQGAGFVMTQVDAATPNVAGIHIKAQILIKALDPADGAPPLLDGGDELFGGILAVVDFTSKNGVGVALSERGGYVGYGLDILTAGSRLVQGKQFYFDNPKTLSQLNQYTQLDVYVAKRSAITLPTNCTQGPVLTDIDGDIPDAAVPADPVVVAVEVITSSLTCEILGGQLALPTWLSTPVILLGSIVKGEGLFSVEYDNFTLDFL